MNSSRLERLPVCGAALALSVLGSCSSILGIEDAVCDPGYDPECARGEATATGEVSSVVAPEGAAGAAASDASGTAGSAPVSSADAGGTSQPAAPSLCATYCAALGANCTGSNQQYASAAACLAVCALLAPGEAGDSSGNTVQCRLGRAALAGTTGEPADYCYSAGPGGAGVCGSDCEGYCSLMTAQCSELGATEACLQACAGVPDLSRAPLSQTYSTASQSGDSLQCRLFHVSAASVDPGGHCRHAAGLEVCVAAAAPSGRANRSGRRSRPGERRLARAPCSPHAAGSEPVPVQRDERASRQAPFRARRADV